MTYERYVEAFGIEKVSDTTRFTFEASPPYSRLEMQDFKRVLINIRTILPNCRIVLCLRQPVIRAYSHYIHDLHQFALFGVNNFGKAKRLLEAPCELTF